MGLFTNSPPQFGQRKSKTSSTHLLQKVHSKEQIIASTLSCGKSTPQFSQQGLSSSIVNNYSINFSISDFQVFLPFTTNFSVFPSLVIIFNPFGTIPSELKKTTSLISFISMINP